MWAMLEGGAETHTDPVRVLTLRRAAALALALLLPLGAVTPPASAVDVVAQPTAYLTGDQTRLAVPTGLALDAAGNRYVSNRDSLSVTV
jgi:hypothetical protein